ncbi:MAG: hypothetical protein Q4A34_03395 [Candidatus Saccharibacteria bacterium]|nr:hypothetical protein [Candidatus Saccharibacteria bacterium]
MNREELLELRGQVVARTKAAVVEGEGPVEDRLPIILELARSGDTGLLRKAFELAGTITDEAGKLDAMLDIIAIIDENLAGSEDSNDTKESEQNPVV